MKVLAKNSRALYDYDIKVQFDAGLVLEGREVKSAKSGNVSLASSYVSVQPHSLHLVKCHIGPFKYAKNDNYDPTRSRTLLLTQSELARLQGKEKGLTVIPLELFIGPRGLLKLKIGIGRGRKKIDKREYIKKRDTDKEIRKTTNR